MNTKKKSLKINLLSIILFLVMVIIITLFGFEIREVVQCTREQAKIEEARHLCEQESENFEDAADDLTTAVWKFAALSKEEYLDDYWAEVNGLRRRDTAVGHLQRLSLTEQEKALIKNAKADSDNLIARETWAMRLVADSAGIPLERMPAQVAAVRYSGGEQALSPDEKRSLALQYLFGEEYASVRESIKGNISSFQEMIRTRKSAELAAAVAHTQGTLHTAQIFMLLLIFSILAETVLYYLLVIRPLHTYSLSLGRLSGKAFAPLIPKGAQETRALAGAFNQIYADWEKQKQSLEQERNRFHVALENTEVIVYEYNFMSDVYTALGELTKSEAQGLRQTERTISCFWAKHAAKFLGTDGVEKLRGMRDGTDYTPVEMQIRTCKEDFPVWVRITGSPVFGESGRLVQLIGKITNIQTEKEKEFALADAKNRDSLTGLYAKEAGIRMVRAYMEAKSPQEICGMMLLDMDNFTRINEAEGQTYADAVLQEVADVLRAETGPDDILVRLGGDEFLLFIKNCPKSRATLLGPRIAEQIRHLPDDKKSDCPVSASIGMCVTEVVDEYSGLYRCTESTLNYVKEHGKGQAACYLDTSNELGTMLTQLYPEQHQINEIDRPGAAREDLVPFGLELLGKAKNLDDAIFLFLSRVGKTCGFDRILIAEVDMDYLTCRVSYQWVQDPADRLPAEVAYVTREDLRRVTSSYDAQGLSEQRILSDDRSMQSVLHAGIWNYGRCEGAMSFEFREPGHRWTPEERRLLAELTRVISSFTLKARADAVSRAKTDFLSRMSHEIRTPMNAITGMTAVAKTVLDNPERALDCLNKIESSNAYLLSLINDVLDMSRIESGKVELHTAPVEVEKLCENLEMMIRPQAEAKGLQFTVKNAFHGEKILADELRLNQVLVNLLGNAVKFTAQGGVTLMVQALFPSDDEAVLRFSVSDSGIGIGEEAKDRIFNAFEQAGSDTAASYGGTGLGLTISSRLVQLMGGALEVESALGKGSEFYFTLSFCFAAAQPEQADGDEFDKGSVNEFDPKGKRLLLAEDNALNQEIALEILSMHGFEVETASNGKEALELFEKRGAGYYDAILMDIRMPVMDGMESTRRIRTLGQGDSRSIPIIAMTADAFDEDMKRSLENGMDAHLSKPVDVGLLMQTLGRLITSGRQ